MIKQLNIVSCLLIFALALIGCAQNGASVPAASGTVGSTSSTTNEDGSIIYDRPTYKGYRLAVTQFESPNGELYCNLQNLKRIDEAAEKTNDVAVYFKQLSSYEEPNPNPTNGPYFETKGWVIRSISCGK